MIRKERRALVAFAVATLSAILIANQNVIAQQQQQQQNELQQQQQQDQLLVRQHTTSIVSNNLPIKTSHQHAISHATTTTHHQPTAQMKLKMKEQQLSKLQKYMNERQLQLVRDNPGSLQAIARALKMTILECQYQMRQEQWDCPIYGTYSAKPVDVFGKLMSRSFRETAFIHSLLSAALTHSIARACSDSRIQTCGRRIIMARDGSAAGGGGAGGSGDSQDIEFAQQFTQQFMEATHEHPANTYSSSNSIQLFNHNHNQYHHLNHQKVSPGSSSLNAIPSGNTQQDQVLASSSQLASSSSLNNNDESINQINPTAPNGPIQLISQPNSLRREYHNSKYLNGNNQMQQQSHQIEMRNSIREMIDAHNDELGRLVSKKPLIQLHNFV